MLDGAWALDAPNWMSETNGGSLPPMRTFGIRGANGLLSAPFRFLPYDTALALRCFGGCWTFLYQIARNPAPLPGQAWAGELVGGM